MPGLIKPLALKKGDTIGVVAPAGAVIPKELERGIQRLEQLGFRVKTGRSVRNAFRFMAGKDRDRARDLLEMFVDPGVKAIVCARGGYGSVRVIPYLDPELIRAHPKVFVGSSDITVLLLYLIQECGLVAFHGPMVCPNFGKDPSHLTETSFLQILTRPDPKASLQLPGVKVLRKGQAEGRLVGGCLSMLCSVLGTPWDPQTDDAILFLEDVRESPYRIDRMLIQLKSAGKLKKVRGVLFGPMWECQPQQESDYHLEDIILDVLDDLDGPVFFGVPSGHGKHNVTLPMGVRVRVDAEEGIEGSDKGLIRLEEEAVCD